MSEFENMLDNLVHNAGGLSPKVVILMHEPPNGEAERTTQRTEVEGFYAVAYSSSQPW